MKNLHLICNAHLDPVWLWRWQEGAAAGISTFRCAADFCDEFDGFVFNHNESLLYKWVEEHEPALFERIKAHVKSGKWKIVGGWYNQPDCNIPSGESFARQILHGKNYFMEKFGVEPDVALNYDSFGHTKGLVQILKKSGYKSYIVARILAPGDYKWVGFDGSEIIAHKTFEGYGSLTGDMENKINRFIEYHRGELPEDAMLLWGVGDHGGGASRRDLNDIANVAQKLKNNDINLIHSDPKTYFDKIDINTLPVLNESIRPFAPGCYTSMTRIKKTHRQLENIIYMSEKMLAHANLVYGTAYDTRMIEEAQEDLMFCEFHDILPGSMIEPGEVDSLNRMGHGIYNMEALQARAFFALSQGQPVAKENTIPVLVYNPHPYPVKAHVSCEFQLSDQNWNYGDFTGGTVYKNGVKVASQFEKEASTMHLDWRKNLIIDAELEPMTMNRFDCVLKTEKNVVNWDIKKHPAKFDFDNGEMQISFDEKTGLIKSYVVNGKRILRDNSAKLIVCDDYEDPWGFSLEKYHKSILGEFRLLTDSEAAEFLGYPDEDAKAFKIIEDGEVRTVVEGIYGYNNSYAVVKFFIPKNGKSIKTDVVIYMNEHNKLVKFSFNTVKGEFIGQTAFGTEALPSDGNAAVFQKFCAVKANDAAFIVSNDGSYSGDYNDGVFNQVLLRTPVYSAHPINLKSYEEDPHCTELRLLSPRDRFMKHIDTGIREFSFEFYGDSDTALADYNAAVFNEKPYALCFFPCGDGEKCGNFITIDNRAVTLSAFKKAYDGNGYIIRLYNSADSEQKVSLKIPCINADKEIVFGKFEVKTFRINTADGSFAETDMIERNL